MKKFLIIFFIGQLLLFTYIFNTSIYKIYELNNVGDTSLKAYEIVELNSSNLSKLYDKFEDEEIELQLIKTPLSENDDTVYNIYHTNENIRKHKSIFSNVKFEYFKLNRDEFIDSTGIFYSKLSLGEIKSITQVIGVEVAPYNENKISYLQIIKYNLINFLTLLTVTQVILFIYTFICIKINAVKKVLGYSEKRMILDEMKKLLKIQVLIVLFNSICLGGYYLVKGNFQIRYFVFLIIFYFFVLIFNSFLLWFTQISIKFIDIGLMIRNKIYSNNINLTIHFVKIFFIIMITISISLFIKNYEVYKAKLEDMDKYRKLNNFYTVSGLNSDEATKMENSDEGMGKYGEATKEIYNLYKENVYFVEYSVANRKDPVRKNEVVINEIYDKSMILNNNYIEDFMELKDYNDKLVNLEANKGPLVLVPEKYRDKEDEVKAICIEKWNLGLNFTKIMSREEFVADNIEDISIIYLKNNQSYELLGSQYIAKDVLLEDCIVIVDIGKFDGSFYFDSLQRSELSFKLDGRDELSKTFKKYKLDKIVSPATLLTPFMQEIHNTKFFMQNSMMFSILFAVTLLFILYVSKYIDFMTNKKEYALKYILGYSFSKIYRNSIIEMLFLLSFVPVIKYFFNLNIQVYVLTIFIDYILLVYFFNSVIKNNLYKVERGG